ncbi:MAG: tRNA adenosine(34) deaminase TadA [Candidatus Omnitrophica bacterium]|nr:tRNA adenosine(34) deaminase TadA [Candidatus Omnitrophota bacterium]
MNKDEFYMREALKQAKKAFDSDEVPVGAIIVYKDSIIGRGHNQIKMLKDPTAHAEMIAITQAAAELKNERLIDCSMYVTIEPCSMCAGALVLARIKHLIYAVDDPKTGACGSITNIVNHNNLNHKVKTKKGVFKEEAAALLREFFNKKRIHGKK